MEVGPLGLGHPLVGDVADDDVAEAERIVAVEPAAVRADELLPDEREERCKNRPLAAILSKRSHGSPFEDAPHDRGPLGDALFERLQSIDAGGDERVNGCGDLDLTGIAIP